MASVEDKIAALRDKQATKNVTGSEEKLNNGQLATIINNLTGRESLQLLKARKAVRAGKITTQDFRTVFRHLVKKSRSRMAGRARSNGAAGSKRGSNG